LRKIIFSTGLLAAVGCGPTIIADGHKLDQRAYEAAVADVKARAKFDFDCSSDKLQTTVLATFGENDVKQFGVSGCDHRGTYVLTSSGWLLNARDGEPERAPSSSSR
jgi:hypothetical protein